jgi:arsenite-transporting ATPase
VSTDPAHSLGDVLGVRLGPEPRRVAHSLEAAELDADRALGRWLREREEAFRTITERGTYLDDEDIDRLLSLSLPGVDELVGLVELVRLVSSRPWDVVVVDTAPTGHTLRLLDMPDTLGRFAEVLDDMHAKHRFLAQSLGGAWRPDFADASIEAIAREATELRELVRDPERTSFTWITLAEELAVRESEHAVASLEERGVRVAVVVTNRVWPEPDRPCPLCTPRTRDERGWRRRIAELFSRDARLLEVPAGVPEPYGLAGLAALAQSVRPASRPTPAKTTPRARRPPLGRPVSLPIPASVRLVLVGGKGGVGKTTVAAATALELAAARPSRRVLVLSTDPAHSLADAFGTPLGDDAVRIAGAPKNLRARELDARAAWEDHRRRHQRAIDDLFASLFHGHMDASFDRTVLEDLVDLAPPGLDELLALVAITEALEDRRLDVVVDTAPTGHTLRLLSLPEKALGWVHALMSIVLKYRSVVGLGEFAGDLTQLAKRLRALIALLSDPRESSFVVVTRASPAPRLETERLVRELARLRVPTCALVVNAVTTPTCSRCSAAAAAERPELRRLARLTRLAKRARTPLMQAPAVYPGPRGVDRLIAWRAGWSYAQAPT